MGQSSRRVATRRRGALRTFVAAALSLPLAGLLAVAPAHAADTRPWTVGLEVIDPSGLYPAGAQIRLDWTCVDSYEVIDGGLIVEPDDAERTASGQLTVTPGEAATVQAPVGFACAFSTGGADEGLYYSPKDTSGWVLIESDGAAPATTKTVTTKESQLPIRKVVSDPAGQAPAGAFDLRVDCTIGGRGLTGFPLTVSLGAGESSSVGVLRGARCTIAEPDSRGAAPVTRPRPGTVPAAGVGARQDATTVYAAGERAEVSVRPLVRGAGALAPAALAYPVRWDCTLNGSSVASGEAALRVGESERLSVPVGSECSAEGLLQVEGIAVTDPAPVVVAPGGADLGVTHAYSLRSVPLVVYSKDPEGLVPADARVGASIQCAIGGAAIDDASLAVAAARFNVASTLSVPAGARCTVMDPVFGPSEKPYVESVSFADDATIPLEGEVPALWARAVMGSEFVSTSGDASTAASTPEQAGVGQEAAPGQTLAATGVESAAALPAGFGAALAAAGALLLFSRRSARRHG